MMDFHDARTLDRRADAHIRATQASHEPVYWSAAFQAAAATAGLALPGLSDASLLLVRAAAWKAAHQSAPVHGYYARQTGMEAVHTPQGWARLSLYGGAEAKSSSFSFFVLDCAGPITGTTTRVMAQVDLSYTVQETL